MRAAWDSRVRRNFRSSSTKAACDDVGGASGFPAEFGIAKGVEAQNPAPGFYGPGLRAERSGCESPVMYGLHERRCRCVSTAVRCCRRDCRQGSSSSRARRRIGAGDRALTVVDAGVLSGLMRKPGSDQESPMVVDAPSARDA